MNRIGSSHIGMGVRWKTGHEKYAAQKDFTSKCRQQAYDYPMSNVECSIESRRVEFDDLKQICCLGMEKNKLESIINLFEWNKEEVMYLEKLSMKGNDEPNILNDKKYRHLTYLFELAYSLAIAPGKNRTNNPTGECQLKYFG